MDNPRAAVRPAFRGDPWSDADVHVVRIALDEYGDGAALCGLLDDKERARATLLGQTDQRRRFTVSHAMLRIVLARALGWTPWAVSFTAGSLGKPAIAGEPLAFSLSHSGERALVAIARAGQLGIDVEQIRPVDTLGLARRFFSHGECAALVAAPHADRLAAFFRCWTRKESFVKARGDGLVCPLDAFDVSLDEHVANALLRCRMTPTCRETWSIVPLAIGDGYVAALALSGKADRVRLWNAPDITAPS